MKTVLIVDDSPFMRLILRNTITKHGFDVIGEANNGRVGVRLFKDLNPDIVTLDVTMDEMNGIEALKQIVEYNASASVLMVSAMGQEVFVRDAIESGARGFIVKPFDETQLVDTLRKL